MSAMAKEKSDLSQMTHSDRRIVFREVEGRPNLRYFLFRPSTERRGAPIVVSVHGIARNAAAHAFRLAEEAERRGTCIIAPLFEKSAFGQYQQLVDRRSNARSDHALLAMIEHAAAGALADPGRILLFGFSGGAQFAHRFAMTHPDRVASAVITSAGWYTLPFPESPYPYGLDLGELMAHDRMDISAFASVPFHVCVGELDTDRDRSLRQSRVLDSTQGRTRIDRARNWVEAMSRETARFANARAPTLTLLPGVGHDFNDCIGRAGLARLTFEFFSQDAALPTRQY